jgi:hypothetical protein
MGRPGIRRAPQPEELTQGMRVLAHRGGPVHEVPHDSPHPVTGPGPLARRPGPDPAPS